MTKSPLHVDATLDPEFVASHRISWEDAYSAARQMHADSMPEHAGSVWNTAHLWILAQELAATHPVLAAALLIVLSEQDELLIGHSPRVVPESTSQPTRSMVAVAATDLPMGKPVVLKEAPRQVDPQSPDFVAGFKEGHRTGRTRGRADSQANAREALRLFDLYASNLMQGANAPACVARDKFRALWDVPVSPLTEAPRIPLTEEQIVFDAVMMMPNDIAASPPKSCEYGIRYAERYHGITGV